MVDYTPLDQTRKIIAYILLGMLGGVILAELVASIILSNDCWNSPKKCSTANAALGMMTGTLNAIFTAMIGLVGSVVGFYFGSQKTTNG